MRTLSLLAVTVVALSLLSCASLPNLDPPDATAVVTDEFGTFAIEVYDQTGLLMGATPVDVDPANIADDAATAVPNRNEIVVAWTGGACAHNPRIDLSGTANELVIELRPEANRVISLLPVACPAVGLPFGVTLSLSQPVEQDAVDFEVVR